MPKGNVMDIEIECAKRGIQYIDRGNGHIQLRGALLVNYYPDSKSKSAYVAGTKKAAKHVTPEQAMDMCFIAPVAQGVKDKRKQNSRRKRVAMFRKGITKCYWCECQLTIDTSTIEHIVPIARGGLENANNRTLACQKCNASRGHDMPELNHTMT